MEKIDLILQKETRGCEIFIGFELLEFMARDLKERPIGDRWVILTDTEVRGVLGDRLQALLVDTGIRTHLIAIPPGEESKQWQTVQGIFEELIQRGFDRRSGLIALGGGVVGDVAGFVASLYMRSIPYVQIPTTLVAQVDSSLGGKNGIDLPHGKNLLGTFYQPLRIYVDPSVLRTLPALEFQCGLAEVIKSAVVKDPGFFRFLEESQRSVMERQSAALKVVVDRCCRIKTSLVMADERDRGVRQVLNFGHTVGHAVETYMNYQIPHGLAVAMGMTAETLLSAKMGMLDAKDEARILDLLRQYGLPMRIPSDSDIDGLIDLMHSDKKALDGQIAMALPTHIGNATVRPNIPVDLVREALKEIQT